jgi:hypothetical protein
MANHKIVPTVKVCPVCQTQFEVGGRGRPNKKTVYCGAVCMGRGQQKIRICQGCSKEFVRTHNAQPKFCSRECLYESMRSRKKCETCGARIIKPNNAHIKYCSKKCYGQAQFKGTEWRSRSTKNWQLKRRFNISLGDYEELLDKQNHACAICKKSEQVLTKNGKNQSLAVDHSHKDNIVRGLLCYKCNRLVGLADDDPNVLENAAQYLRG